MKKIKQFLIIQLFVCSFSIQAQIDAASALVALEELDVTVENSMNHLQLIVDNAIGDSGNMLISVISRLREDIKNTIGDTDKMLRDNQQILFDKLSSEVKEFNKIVEDRIVDVDGIATRVTSAANDFWVKKNEPRIITYKTPTYTFGSNTFYEFNVVGEDFDRSYEKHLEIDSIRVPITQISQNKIKVIVPAEIMNKVNSDNTRFINCKFTFKYKKGFIFKRKRTKHFDFVIPCVPKAIGVAIAYYEQKLPEIQYFPVKTYEAKVHTGGTSCLGSRRTGRAGINVLPVNGRYIDPTSFKITSWYRRYGGGYTINSVTEQYIRGNIMCKSQSKPCGGGGKARLIFQYREYKTNYPLRKSETPVVSLEADKLSVIDLPSVVDGHKPYLNYVKVLTFDGREHIITTTNPSNYFSLSQNASTNSLELKFKL